MVKCVVYYHGRKSRVLTMFEAWWLTDQLKQLNERYTIEFVQG